METFSSIIIDDYYYQRYNKSSTIHHDIAVEDMNYMSFAGIVFYDGTMLAFADSKSTVKGERGDTEDPEYQSVQKIFQNKHFLFTLTGTNSMTPKNETKRILLKDWVNAHLQEWDTPDEFSRDLYLYFQNTEFIEPPVVIVEAGHRDKAFGLTAYRAEIGVGIFHETTWIPKERDVIFDGDRTYAEFFNVNRNLLYTDDEEQLKSALEQREEKLKMAVGYIPVGGPWNTVKMTI